MIKIKYPDEAESKLSDDGVGESVDDEVDIDEGNSREKKSFLYDMLLFNVPEIQIIFT